VARDGYNLWGLLGILNSSLLNWLFSVSFYDYEIKPIYLRQAPLADEADIRLVKLVREMLHAVANREAARTAEQRTYASRQVANLDRRINNEVYRLYRISHAERELIEEQMRSTFVSDVSANASEISEVVNRWRSA
jgi:adenine-specific DNA-methyltransferase